MTHFTLAAIGLVLSGAASLLLSSYLGQARWAAVAVVPIVWFLLLAAARALHRRRLSRLVERGEHGGSQRDADALRALGVSARAQAAAAGEPGFTREIGPAPALERAVIAPWTNTDEAAVIGELVQAGLAARQALVAGLRDTHDEAIAALGAPLHPLYPDAPRLLRLVGHPLPILFTRLRTEGIWRERRRMFDPREPDLAIAVRLLAAGLPDAALVALPPGHSDELTSRLRRLGRFLSILRRGESGSLALRPDEFAAWAPELMLLAGRKVRELTPESPFVAAVRGGAAALERAVGSRPEFVRELAELRREVPELDTAIVLVIARLVVRPESVVRAALKSGRLEVAADTVLQSHLRGLALLAENRPREAIGEFEAVLEREPGFGFAAYALARAWARLGDDERAEGFLRTALERRPGDQDLHLALARFLAELGDEDGAREAYDDALARFPRSISLRVAYAQQLSNWGDDTASRDHLDTAHGHNPEDARLAFMAGRARVTTGNAEEAISPLERAVRGLHGRERAEAQFWLLWAFREQGRHDQAMTLADRVLRGLGSGQEGLLDELADYFEEQHDFQRARAANDRARQLRGGYGG